MAVEGYDLMMLGVLAAAAVLGYFKGIVWQIAWIAGIAASTFVAVRFAAVVAPFTGQPAPWNRLLAMLALYVATSLVVWLLFRVVSGAINAVHLSAFDHQLGLLFGLAKGVLLCVVITFFAVTLAPGYRPQIVGSKSGRIVAEIITRSDELLPPDLAETVMPFVKQFEEQLQPGSGAGPAAPARGVAGQPSPLGAIWEGVTSAAAWTGAEPAGQGTGQGFFGQQAGPGNGQAVGPGAAPGIEPRFGQGARQAGGAAAERNPWPSAGQQVGYPPSVPPPTSGFAPQPIVPPRPAPQPFPIGAQSPLPIR